MCAKIYILSIHVYINIYLYTHLPEGTVLTQIEYQESVGNVQAITGSNMHLASRMWRDYWEEGGRKE